jgi:hypothetical protein
MTSEQPPSPAQASTSRRLPLWLMILGTGLTTGLLAAVGGEFTYQAFDKEPEYPASVNGLPGSERAVSRAVIRFNTKKTVSTNQAAAAYGLLGMTLGVILGLAGGFAAGSARAHAGAAAVGGALGGVAGAGLAMVMVPLFFEYSDAQTTAFWILLAHAAIFAGVGAAGGLALGWAWGPRGPIFRCIVGGIAGALIGTLVVDITNVATSGVARIFEPIPAQPGARFVVDVGIALCAVLGAALAGRKRRSRPS